MKTQFSRRELYALGEPLGESATRVVAGRRIYGGGGGIGGMMNNVAGSVGASGPVSTDGGAALAAANARSNAMTGIGNPNTMKMGLYEPPPDSYSGAAPFSNASPAPQSSPAVNPMTQADVQQGVAGYAQPYVNTMLGATMQNLFDYDANGNAIGMKQYNPYSYNPADYVAGFSPLQQQVQQGVAGMQMPGQFGNATNYAEQATQGLLNQQYNPQTGGYGRVGTQKFTGDQVGQYMNPYLQNALDPQLKEIQRQYDITGAQEAGRATGAGAFGGSRQAVMQAENQRNKNTAMNQAIGQGFNTAYNNAANQFNTSQSQSLQAQQANQQARQAAQNLAAQQQQFGANYGMQGRQSALSGANTLGNLGTSQLGAQQGIYGLQNQIGQQQQGQQQNIINQGVKNYETAQQYPMQQLGQMKGMLQGLPIATTSQQNYQAAPSNLSNLVGLGLGGAGIAKLLGGDSGNAAGGGGLNIPGFLNSGSDLIGSGISAIGSGLGGAFDSIKGLFNFQEGGQVNAPRGGSGLSDLGIYNATKR